MGRMMGGGVEAITMNYYKWLNHSKVQYDFIVQEDSTNVPLDVIKQSGGRVFTVPTYKKLAKYERALERIFKETNPDIVHSNMNALSVFPLRAAAKAHIPVRIAHSHSTSNPHEVLKTTVKNMLRPLSTIYPTHLAACGTLSASWLFGEKKVAEGEVHYIRNAIDLQAYTFNASKRETLRSSLGISNEQPVIGQIGRFSAQKNQDFSIDIFKEFLKIHPNAVLVFLGIGDTELAMKRKVRDLDITDHVHFMGLRNDAASWYSAFDVLLFPSLYEGLPLTAIEAQAAGLPIVASNHITEEAFINKSLVTTVPLSRPPAEWAQILADTHNQTETHFRAAHLETLKEAGYDIHESVKDLERWYEEIFTNSKVSQ